MPLIQVLLNLSARSSIDCDESCPVTVGDERNLTWAYSKSSHAQTQALECSLCPYFKGEIVLYFQGTRCLIVSRLYAFLLGNFLVVHCAVVQSLGEQHVLQGMLWPV